MNRPQDECVSFMRSILSGPESQQQQKQQQLPAGTPLSPPMQHQSYDEDEDEESALSEEYEDTRRDRRLYEFPNGRDGDGSAGTSALLTKNVGPTPTSTVMRGSHGMSLSVEDEEDEDEEDEDEHVNVSSTGRYSWQSQIKQENGIDSDDVDENGQAGPYHRQNRTDDIVAAPVVSNGQADNKKQSHLISLPVICTPVLSSHDIKYENTKALSQCHRILLQNVEMLFDSDKKIALFRCIHCRDNDSPFVMKTLTVAEFCDGLLQDFLDHIIDSCPMVTRGLIDQVKQCSYVEDTADRSRSRIDLRSFCEVYFKKKSYLSLFATIPKEEKKPTTISTPPQPQDPALIDLSLIINSHKGPEDPFKKLSKMDQLIIKQIKLIGRRSDPTKDISSIRDLQLECAHCGEARVIPCIEQFITTIHTLKSVHVLDCPDLPSSVCDEIRFLKTDKENSTSKHGVFSDYCYHVMQHYCLCNTSAANGGGVGIKAKSLKMLLHKKMKRSRQSQSGAGGGRPMAPGGGVNVTNGGAGDGVQFDKKFDASILSNPLQEFPLITPDTMVFFDQLTPMDQILVKHLKLTGRKAERDVVSLKLQCRYCSAFRNIRCGGSFVKAMRNMKHVHTLSCSNLPPHVKEEIFHLKGTRTAKGSLSDYCDHIIKHYDLFEVKAPPPPRLHNKHDGVPDGMPSSMMKPPKRPHGNSLAYKRNQAAYEQIKPQYANNFERRAGTDVCLPVSMVKIEVTDDISKIPQYFPVEYETEFPSHGPLSSTPCLVSFHFAFLSYFEIIDENWGYNNWIVSMRCKQCRKVYKIKSVESFYSTVMNLKLHFKMCLPQSMEIYLMIEKLKERDKDYTHPRSQKTLQITGGSGGPGSYINPINMRKYVRYISQYFDLIDVDGGVAFRRRHQQRNVNQGDDELNFVHPMVRQKLIPTSTTGNSQSIKQEIESSKDISSYDNVVDEDEDDEDDEDDNDDDDANESDQKEDSHNDESMYATQDAVALAFMKHRKSTTPEKDQNQSSTFILPTSTPSSTQTPAIDKIPSTCKKELSKMNTPNATATSPASTIINTPLPPPKPTSDMPSFLLSIIENTEIFTITREDWHYFLTYTELLSSSPYRNEYYVGKVGARCIHCHRHRVNQLKKHPVDNIMSSSRSRKRKLDDEVDDPTAPFILLQSTSSMAADFMTYMGYHHIDTCHHSPAGIVRTMQSKRHKMFSLEYAKERSSMQEYCNYVVETYGLVDDPDGGVIMGDNGTTDATKAETVKRENEMTECGKRALDKEFVEKEGEPMIAADDKKGFEEQQDVVNENTIDKSTTNFGELKDDSTSDDHDNAMGGVKSNGGSMDIDEERDAEMKPPQ